MGSLYLTWLADELRAAGCAVVEYDGWQSRARSSGGFDANPLCVMWHHTASNTSPSNDASYMCHGSSDRPIANILIARDGQVWVLAAGATNTNGKGGPLTFSRGTCPLDSMNTRALGVEIANTGVGEQYPQAQVDAMFRVSNACNARFGNVPGDVSSHNLWAPSRKIDPANVNVAGPWVPSATTSSGTWSTDDIRAECANRAGGGPPPDGGFDLSQQQYDDIMAKLDYISRQCDGIAVNIYGNPDGQNPPYNASVWGRIDTVSRQVADVMSNSNAELATLWGNTENPPYNLSVNGMLVQLLTLAGANPWEPASDPAVLSVAPPPPGEPSTPPPEGGGDAGRGLLG